MSFFFQSLMYTIYNLLLPYGFAFCFGALIGNFATTILYRVPNRMKLYDFSTGASCPPFCSVCKHLLKYYEFLPILSWITTGGKCNYCNAAIGKIYIVLEVLAGILSIICYHLFGLSEQYIILFFIGVGILLQSFIYSQHMRRESLVILAIIVFGVLYRTLVDGTISRWIGTLCLGCSASMLFLKSKRLNNSTKYDLSALTVQASSLLEFKPLFILGLCSSAIFYIGSLFKKSKYPYLISLIILLFMLYNDHAICVEPLPDGFVYLHDVCPSIVEDIKYATDDNFTGAHVPGYNRGVAIATMVAAERLCQVQNEVAKDGYGLKVFDFYRPVTAVQAFKEWSLRPEDGKTKDRFYPNLDKADLFKGYISDKSTHSRGSTVDLTLIRLADGSEVDMGTEFDLLDPKSHTENPETPADILGNRLYLKRVMEKYGFENYRREWWHYQLCKDIEPFSRYPEDHKDFPVE